jgi:hypothetical protein
MEATYGDAPAGAIDRKRGSEQVGVTPEQERAANAERPVRPAVGKQAIHGKESVSQSPITVEVVRRTGEHDLAVGLQCNLHGTLFRIGADRLANEAAASECLIQASAPVESSNRELSPNSAADHHSTTSLDRDAARRIVAAEGGEDTPTAAKG